MARINIEDALFTDDRWIKLVLKVGNKNLALGLVTGAWILAQKHWLKHKMIPKKAWSSEYDPLIEVELATRRADGNVYVKGSKKAFGWYEQRVEAGRLGGAASTSKKSKASRKNGLLGGRPPLSEKPTDDPWVFSDEDSRLKESDSRSYMIEENPSDREAKSSKIEQSQASSSSSSSSSSSFSFSSSNSDSGSKEDLILSKLGSEKSSRRSNRADKSGSHGCIAELSDDPVCRELLSSSTESAQRAWLEAYPSPDFVKQECRRAKAWIASNPQKRPKNFQRFFANWLSRAFETYRKGLKSRPMTSAEVNAMSLTEMWDKNERGEL
jgi:hypothetical protein